MIAPVEMTTDATPHTKDTEDEAKEWDRAMEVVIVTVDSQTGAIEALAEVTNTPMPEVIDQKDEGKILDDAATLDGMVIMGIVTIDMTDLHVTKGVAVTVMLVTTAITAGDTSSPVDLAITSADTTATSDTTDIMNAATSLTLTDIMATTTDSSHTIVDIITDDTTNLRAIDSDATGIDSMDHVSTAMAVGEQVDITSLDEVTAHQQDGRMPVDQLPSRCSTRTPMARSPRMKCSPPSHPSTRTMMAR